MRIVAKSMIRDEEDNTDDDDGDFEDDGDDDGNTEGNDNIDKKALRALRLPDDNT